MGPPAKGPYNISPTTKGPLTAPELLSAAP